MDGNQTPPWPGPKSLFPVPGGGVQPARRPQRPRGSSAGCGDPPAGPVTRSKRHAQDEREQQRRLDLIRHPAILEHVWERLPPQDRAFTIRLVHKEGRRWAAEHEPPPASFGAVDLALPPPVWLLRRKWPAFRTEQRGRLEQRAAFHGLLEQLQWMIAQPNRAGAVRGAKLCTLAAKGGHLAVLQWARWQGCPWDETTCQGAAEGGHLAVLQWAWRYDCPRDKWTCEGAARGGHLAVLLWARQYGCPWDEWTCKGAARGGHLAVLQWVRQ